MDNYISYVRALGLSGLAILPFAILLLQGKTIGIFRGMKPETEATFNKKKTTRFLGIIYLIVVFICFGGALLAIFELVPIPILRILSFTPIMSVVSVFYLNKSKRFRNTE